MWSALLSLDICFRACAAAVYTPYGYGYPSFNNGNDCLYNMQCTFKEPRVLNGLEKCLSRYVIYLVRLLGVE
jgi:hypothetical protein